MTSLDLSPCLNAPPCSDVLLVEDNPGDAHLISMFLQTNRLSPMQVDRAETLDQGIEAIRSKPYQAVILDLGLPDSQGISTLMKMQIAADQTPIVVLSGGDDLQLSSEVVRFGAQDFISKDALSSSHLLRTLRLAIERQSILVQANTEAYIDELTGLFNRRGFHSVAEPACLHAAENHQSVCVLCADMSNLKGTNDQLGHTAEDAAIVETARLIENSFREGDIIGRLEGGEFVILIADAGRCMSDAFIERILNAVIQRNRVYADKRPLDLSVGGVVVNHQASISLVRMMEMSNLAMCTNKLNLKQSTTVS